MTFHVGDLLRDGWGTDRVITRVDSSYVYYTHPTFGESVKPLHDLNDYVTRGMLVLVRQYGHTVALPDGV